jgi:hypothetical protein
VTDRPTRTTAAGAAFLDLRKLGRRTGRSTAELIQLYALEGFLLRLSRSAVHDQLVLKGGMLLAAFGARRPTKDLDFLALEVPGELELIRDLIGSVARVPADDGLEFASTTTRVKAIRTEDVYPGVRVSLPVTLSSARLDLHVDVNVGDPLWPGPDDVRLPRLLDPAPIELLGSPLHMVLAEKIVTAIQRGTANTRWRDFADVFSLSQKQGVAGHDLQRAADEVAAYRGIDLIPLRDALPGFAEIAQPRWAAWRRRQALEDQLPANFAVVLHAVAEFADPALTERVEGLRWEPLLGKWNPEDT